MLQVSLSQAINPTALVAAAMHPHQAAASPDSTSDLGECKLSHLCTVLQCRRGVQAATEPQVQLCLASPSLFLPQGILGKHF